MKAFCWNGSKSSSEGCVRLIFGYPKNQARLGSSGSFGEGFAKAMRCFMSKRLDFMPSLK